MSDKENPNESDSELNIEEIDKKISRKNTKIKTAYVEELKEFLDREKKDHTDEKNVSVRIFKKPIEGEHNSNSNEFRYSTISDEIDNSFGYLNDSSYSSDQDDTNVNDNLFKFVKDQKDDDFYKELNKVLEKYPNGPKNKLETKVRSSLNGASNDKIEEKIFIDNYRQTLQDKMKPDEIEQEVKRVRVFFDWLAVNHGIYLFKKKDNNNNNIVVNVFHPSASENTFSNNPKKVMYKPVEEGINLKNLELRIYFDSKKYKNLLDIDQLDLFLTDPNDDEMLKLNKSEKTQNQANTEESKQEVDERPSENSMFNRLNKINPFKRIKGFSLTPINVFRQKK